MRPWQCGTCTHESLSIHLHCQGAGNARGGGRKRRKEVPNTSFAVGHQFIDRWGCLKCVAGSWYGETDFPVLLDAGLQQELDFVILLYSLRVGLRLRHEWLVSTMCCRIGTVSTSRTWCCCSKLHRSTRHPARRGSKLLSTYRYGISNLDANIAKCMPIMVPCTGMLVLLLKTSITSRSRIAARLIH